MVKNTGMTAKEEKAGKIPALPPEKAKAVTKKLKEESKAPAPTKTVELVNKGRAKKKESPGPADKIFKSH